MRLRTTFAALALTALAGCFGADGGALIRAGVPTGNILVRNASHATITVVTVSQCDAMSHGFNRLPSGVTLSPGEAWRFTVSAGCYDVQAGYGWGTGYAVADFNNKYVPAGRTFTLTVN